MEEKMLKKLSQNILKIILVSYGIIMLFIILNGVYNYEKVVYKYNPIYLTIAILGYIYVIKYTYKLIIPKLKKNKVVIYSLFAVFTIGCIFSRLVF